MRDLDFLCRADFRCKALPPPTFINKHYKRTTKGTQRRSNDALKVQEKYEGNTEDIRNGR